MSSDSGVIDVFVRTGGIDPGAYWRKLKERLKKEGNETVANCHALKMVGADGKMRLTDVADAEHTLPLTTAFQANRLCPIYDE